MLVQFAFKNFKSFRDDTILDLSATRITEHADHVTQLGQEKILPAASIFGANASGKSNVLEAFRYMTVYVSDSFAYGGEEKETKSQIKKPQYTPFLFDNASRDAESTFELHFTTGEEDGCKTYNYGFVLNREGIVEEWLNSKARTARDYRRIFYRSKEELDLSGIPKKNQHAIEASLYGEALVVSLGAKQRVAKLKFVRDWFGDIEFADFGRPLENLWLSSLVPPNFGYDKAVQDKVVDYFAAFDPSIIGFNVERSTINENEYLKIDALHRVIGSGEVAAIPLADESAGTLKMLALYSPLQNVLDRGSVMCVDELSSRLHPLLARNLVATFLNPKTNPKRAQLVFTTHDPWQLSNGQLRRDEVWFTEKVDSGISRLYSLADFVDEDGKKIRIDESYEKNYLLGRYGAIPSLKSFDMFVES